MKRFENKICLITASSTGIGFSIASRIASEGGIVIISSRKKENVDEKVQVLKSKGWNAFGFPCHVGDISQRKALISFIETNFGRIDVLVLNAAISTSMGNLLDTPSEEMDKMFSLNVKCAILLTSECLQLLKKGNNPSVVIVSSYTSIQPSPVLGFYGITKTALLGLNKALAIELQPQGIRVNCVCPGLIKTRFSSVLWKDTEEITKETMGVQRLGVVEDISSAVAFLASEEASYIFGENLFISGKPNQRL